MTTKTTDKNTKSSEETPKKKRDLNKMRFEVGLVPWGGFNKPKQTKKEFKKYIRKKS